MLINNINDVQFFGNLVRRHSTGAKRQYLQFAEARDELGAVTPRVFGHTSRLQQVLEPQFDVGEVEEAVGVPILGQAVPVKVL